MIRTIPCASTAMTVLMLLTLLPLFSGLTPTGSKLPTILCFGNACVDQLAICDHFPHPDEKIYSSSLQFEGGGNAANSACAMGRLSDYVQAQVGTAIGKDDYGDRILQGLKDNHVGVHNIERFDGISPFSYILVTPNPNARTIIHQPATRDMTLEFADQIDLNPFAAVHFDGRQPEAAMRLAAKCHQMDIPYSVDAERPRGLGHDELLAQASLIICSSDYCNQVLGEPDHQLQPVELVERLRQVARSQAPNAVMALQTVGSKGSYLIRLQGNEDDTNTDQTVLPGDESTGLPTVACYSGALWCPVWGGMTEADIVDSTGAGDAFQGGFLTGLWSYHTSRTNKKSLDPQIPLEALAHCMRIGTRVAAQKLTALGARTGLPYSHKDAVLQQEFQSLLALSDGRH